MRKNINENLRNEFLYLISYGPIKAELIRPNNGTPFLLYEDIDEDFGIIFIDENMDIKHISPVNIDSLLSDQYSTTGVEIYDSEKHVDVLIGMLRRAYTIYMENVEYLEKIRG